MNLSFKETLISQFPALKLLQNLGWKYLSRAEVDSLRGGRSKEVLLEPILTEQLNQINNPSVNGVATQKFSPHNIEVAIERLKTLNTSDGYVATCSEVYDLLTLGTTVRQTIDSLTRDLPFYYIDWHNTERNVFHVVEEFSVTRTGSSETYRPDIVLFVNGIPMCVIECKRPDIKGSMEQAISQHLRNQQPDGIRSLFYYTALLLGVNTNEMKYATNSTPPKFWSVWNEQFISKEEEKVYNDALEEAVNAPLDSDVISKISAGDGYTLAYIKEREAEHITPTPQDRGLFSLCRMDRFLDIIHSFTLFDNSIRKVARYQQYFAIKKSMERLQHISGGKRRGGVVWHTQGSGKSLTMVMLSRAIIEQTRRSANNIKNPKIIVVTDRTDLDAQITDTLRHCDVVVHNATTGRGLADLLEAPSDAVVTTLVHKFRTAVREIRRPLLSHDIFVLIDEGHRSQYGEMSIAMQKAMPNACFIAMTGTPLMKKDKSTAERFGDIIRPAYTVAQAVSDGAVVPLLYEGRHAFQEVNSNQIDKYFELITEDLSDEAKADFKRKFSNRNHLNVAEQKIEAIAWDISLHYQKNWQGTGFKGQLVCQSKAAAVMYKKFFDLIGRVTSEVVISSPDMRESEEDSFESNDEVKLFYKKMIDKYGKPDIYERSIINAFKGDGEPEIIIVVSKLTTGFDVPQNTVLYITKSMQEHELLQTVARVNRVAEGKDFGYIVDYYGVLKELHTALELYSSEDEEDMEAYNDIMGTFTSITDEIATLKQKHAELWDIFKELKGCKDFELYQLHLRGEELRGQFYDKLTAYSKTLKIALSAIEFHNTTSEEQIAKYKSDLNFFLKLRKAVQERYAETIDYKKHEVKIQNLIDQHIPTSEVRVVTELVNIFEKEKFEQEVERVEGAAAKADTIAHRTKRYISEKMEEDPVFYRKFSKMLEDAIAEYLEHRDAEKYLVASTEIMEAVRSHTDSDIPSDIVDLDTVRAIYGLTYELLRDKLENHDLCSEISKAAAFKVDEIIRSRIVVDWKIKRNLADLMLLDMEDYFIDEIRDKYNIKLSFDEIDSVTFKAIDIAKMLIK